MLLAELEQMGSLLVECARATAVPAGQLDLADGISPDEMAHFNAYRELLFADNEQILVNGALQDTANIVAPSMSAAGANASNGFFSRFDAGDRDGRGLQFLRMDQEVPDKVGAEHHPRRYQDSDTDLFI